MQQYSDYEGLQLVNRKETANT